MNNYRPARAPRRHTNVLCQRCIGAELEMICESGISLCLNCCSFHVPHVHRHVHWPLMCPHRLAWQNFEKASRCGHVRILILFMTKAVDIFISMTGARNEDFLQPRGRRLESLTSIVLPLF